MPHGGFERLKRPNGRVAQAFGITASGGAPLLAFFARGGCGSAYAARVPISSFRMLVRSNVPPFHSINLGGIKDSSIPKTGQQSFNHPTRSWNSHLQLC